ncbi:hypothetical protein L596_002579 [Steinernema carpocapsae]|uniref:Uncharacterized protein n=1 Tax=Steinernema carpocapsae TaxID=34508 RepID=A0A4U8URH4_STECR|nr:hypothetical protein L596_002579 [Steinernema carpocapsae]
MNHETSLEEIRLSNEHAKPTSERSPVFVSRIALFLCTFLTLVVIAEIYVLNVLLFAHLVFAKMIMVSNTAGGWTFIRRARTADPDCLQCPAAVAIVTEVRSVLMLNLP